MCGIAGIVSGGAAVWPAIVGLIAASIADADDAVLVGETLVTSSDPAATVAELTC